MSRTTKTSSDAETRGRSLLRELAAMPEPVGKEFTGFDEKRRAIDEAVNRYLDETRWAATHPPAASNAA